MAEIGNLSVRIDADTSGLERGTRQGERRLREFSSGMERATSIARRLSGVLAAIGVGVGFGQAIREIANFQAAMNGLAAVSGATADEMERLEDQARTLGATSQFSAQQAAEAQRFLAQAGFEVNETLGATPGILQLATAAQLDLGTAADIASNVLGGMRLEVDELSRVNDVLAATASRSNTTIQQLGQALSFAAPFAASAGVSIEEAAAAIGVMSDAGIQASRAGTGMVGVIRQLSRVTSAGEDALAKYGLSMEDVDITTRGLQPVLETLRQVNLSTADAIEIFGSEAGAAAQVLVNDYQGAIEGATGEAERMADQIEQGLGPAFRSLQSAAAEAVLQMGDSGLAGALEALVNTTTGVISVFNGMEKEWAEANDVGDSMLTTVRALSTTIEALSVIVASRLTVAVGTYAATQIRANAAMLSGAGAARALSGAMALVGGPLGILVGAGGLLFAFREELGLVPRPAAKVEEHLDGITSSVDGLNDAMLDLRIAAFGAELAQLGTQAEVLTKRVSTLNRVSTDPNSFGQGMQGDIQSGLAQTERDLEDTENRIKAIQKGMEDIRNLRRGERGEDGDGVDDPGAPDTPVVSTRDGAGTEGEDDPARFMGGIGIFGEEENQAFIERLKAQLEMRDGILREYDVLDTERQQEKFEADMERLREALELESITEQEFRAAREELEHDHWSKIAGIRENALSDMANMARKHYNSEVGLAVDAFGTILGALSQHNKEAFRIQKAFAIASAVINTAQGVTQALAAYPPPLSFVMAGAVAAAGAAEIAAIKSQSFSGGGSSGSRGSGGVSTGGAGSVAQQQTQQQQRENTIATINLTDEGMYSGRQVRGLIESINEELDNGMRLRIN